MIISLIFLLWILCGLPSLLQAEPIAIIVHPDSPIHSLTWAQLERIYKGRQSTWPNGDNIVATNRPPSNRLRQQFYRVVLNAKATQQFLRPGSPIPFKTKRLKSEKAMKRFVRRVPSAIGYLSLKDVDNTVKVLPMDGRLPSEPDYRLR